MDSTGKLIVIATPLGNLGDIPPRAIETLPAVDLILAEDTRVFQKLATRFEIRTPVKSYHDHNERGLAPRIAEEIAGGKRVALVSDAGTPAISDPGYRIVLECRTRALPVEGVPGPCAAILALSISGFETDRFLFEGFLPMKPGKRGKRLRAILDAGITTVLYESTHRIHKLLKEIADIEPSRELFIARELTKLHEEHITGSASELAAKLADRGLKGEIVLIVRKGSEEDSKELSQE